MATEISPGVRFAVATDRYVKLEGQQVLSETGKHFLQLAKDRLQPLIQAFRQEGYFARIATATTPVERHWNEVELELLEQIEENLQLAEAELTAPPE